MFSICTKGMADFLNLTPGGPMARLTSLEGSVSQCVVPMGQQGGRSYLHRATPSFKPSSRSFPGSRSPSMLSIHALTSLAAAGVYLSRRSLRKSLSREETDAMTMTAGEEVGLGGGVGVVVVQGLTRYIEVEREKENERRCWCRGRGRTLPWLSALTVDSVVRRIAGREMVGGDNKLLQNKWLGVGCLGIFCCFPGSGLVGSSINNYFSAESPSFPVMSRLCCRFRIPTTRNEQCSAPPR